MARLHCIIVTPEATELDQQADFVASFLTEPLH